MLIKLYNENPNHKDILKIAECLRDGGVIIYPTDTIYGIGCDISNHKSVERITEIMRIKKDKAMFSFICHDLSHLSDYSKPLNNSIFKIMKRVLPGPYTFILNANNNVPKLLSSKKKTVGIRIPDNNIIREIVLELGNPILSKSITDEDDIVENITDPELIFERFGDFVDIVIDGGYGDFEPSTILDCTGETIEVIREGKGSIDFI